MSAQPSPSARVPLTRWRRPDALELELTTSVSTSYREAEALGWERWEGRIWALWDDTHWTTDTDAGDDLPLPPEHGTGWGGSDLEGIDYEGRLEVGHLERWMRALDSDVGSLIGAAEPIAASLLHVVEAIAGDGDEPLRKECAEQTGQPWFDSLLVLHSVELVPQIRGYGIGAWASARSIQLLARDSGTLIATKAAPLHADQSRQDRDRSSRLDEADKDEAWQRAQMKIAAHWQSSLGLVPLPENPEFLLGTIDTTHRALQATIDAWKQD